MTLPISDSDQRALSDPDTGALWYRATGLVDAPIRTKRGRPPGSRSKKDEEEWLVVAAKIDPMVASGMTMRAIGEYLGIDHHTVNQWRQDYQRWSEQKSGE